MRRSRAARLHCLILPVLVPAAAACVTVPARAGWLSDWQYRRAVTVPNSAGQDLSEYQVSVRLGADFDFSNAAADGGDLRVTLEDGVTEIPYWIESWSPEASSAWIWVRVPDIPTNGATTYLYYGRNGATPQSNGDATFAAYDGFEEFPAGNPGEWARSAESPVLTVGPPGSWDAGGATFASVIRDEAAGEFRMYYHGWSGVPTQVGLATSPDGLHWTKHPGNPIVTPSPGQWDGTGIRVPMVWKEGETYHMLYTGLGPGGEQFGYATSADGIAWTKHPANPVFNDPTWAHNSTENWGVIKADGRYVAWYSTGGVRRCGLAVSPDLLHWEPYQVDPIFDSSGEPSDDRFSQFCPFSFKHGDDYYVLVCSYDAYSNYSSFYLYRCPNPYFLEADRHLVRIAHTVGAFGSWDDHDSDTPAVLTLDIERTQFYNDELWCYYAAEGGPWQMGLHLETDLAAALADAPVPEIDWHAEGVVTTVDAPVRQGLWSRRLEDASSGGVTWMRGAFPPRQRGVIGAWMQRSSTSVGDVDIYLRGEGGETAPCRAGMGGFGDFHYWSAAGMGGFQHTGVFWSPDTWYLVTLAFDAEASRYDFAVFDESLVRLVDARDIAFGEPSADLCWIDFQESPSYVGVGHVDGYRLREWCGVELEALVGEEEGAAGAPEPPMAAAARLRLSAAPNPFHPHRRGSTLRYAPDRDRPVRLDVYDVHGRRVAALVDAWLGPGPRFVIWDGRGLRGERVPAGSYVCRLRAGERTESLRLTLVR